MTSIPGSVTCCSDGLDSCAVISADTLCRVLRKDVSHTAQLRLGDATQAVLVACRICMSCVVL